MKYIHRTIESRIASVLLSRKILILLGARQVGKTTLMQNIVKDTHHTFLNMDRAVDTTRLLTASRLSPKEAFRSLGSPDIVVIDEAQRVPEVGHIIKGWYDSAIPCKIVLLGSSSLDLLDQTAEHLTGRNIKCILSPMTIRESLSTQSWFDTEIAISVLAETKYEQFHAFLLNRLAYGSYPESLLSSQPADYLQNLVEDYLFKDIYSLGLTRSPQTLRKLIQLLALQVGSEISVNELSTSMGVSRVTIERYLELLEQTFVIFRVKPYFTNARKELVKNSKIYFWDTGVRNALIGQLEPIGERLDIGQLWENWVMAEWKKKYSNADRPVALHFWRQRQGSEIDIIVKRESKLEAFECKWSTKKRLGNVLFTKIYGTPVRYLTPITVWQYLL